jgi:hypothetical protein
MEVPWYGRNGKKQFENQDLVKNFTRFFNLEGIGNHLLNICIRINMEYTKQIRIILKMHSTALYSTC